jgi:hypothetical protein
MSSFQVGIIARLQQHGKTRGEKNLLTFLQIKTQRA